MVSDGCPVIHSCSGVSDQVAADPGDEVKANCSDGSPKSVERRSWQ
jgi:hypothetical protein